MSLIDVKYFQLPYGWSDRVMPCRSLGIFSAGNAGRPDIDNLVGLNTQMRGCRLRSCRRLSSRVALAEFRDRRNHVAHTASPETPMQNDVAPSPSNSFKSMSNQERKTFWVCLNAWMLETRAVQIYGLGHADKMQSKAAFVPVTMTGNHLSFRLRS